MTPSTSKDQKLMKQLDEIHELKERQMQGIDRMPTVPANKNPKYKIREDESAKYVVVRVGIKHNSTAQKTYVLEERFLYFHLNEFQRKIEEKYFIHYDEVEVIHDPRKSAPSSYDILNKEGVVKLSEDQGVKSNESALKKSIESIKEKEIGIVNAQEQLAKRQAELDAKEADINRRFAQLSALPNQPAPIQDEKSKK